MKSYKQHLETTKSFGEKITQKLKPVFRSSAIFTVMNDENLKTRILYMGYWLTKRNISEVGLLTTLRDQKGGILHRENYLIQSPEAREINIQELLDKIQYAEKKFIGSIELEIFSTRDLVFPYPAFVVNYYNDFGSGVVHTTGRIYNDFEDVKSNEGVLIEECGFDIFPGEAYDPFFTFVNGYIEKEDNILEIEIITENDSRYKKEINLGKINALEAVIFKFKEHLPIDEILGGSIGTVKIKHNLKGFFPRFIAGNFCKNTGSVSITHTYYDNSKNKGKTAYWTNEHDNILYDSTVYVPLFVDDNWYTHLKLYPIYSPSTHSISILFYNAVGELKGKIDEYKFVQEDMNNFISIDFGTLINKLGLDRSEIKGAYLIKNCDDKSRIPARLKYGLNVGKKNANYDLPTNICFASVVSNIKILDKKGTFKWLPILNQGNSVAVIENSSYIKNYDQPANLDVTFYQKDAEETIKKNYVLPANGQIRLVVNDELSTFLGDNSGWVTIKSDNPFIKAWYFEFNESGIMGGDHSF